MAETTSRPAHTDFMTADGVRHEIWRVPMHSPSGKAFSDTWGREDVLYLATATTAWLRRTGSTRPGLTCQARRTSWPWWCQKRTSPSSAFTRSTRHLHDA